MPWRWIVVRATSKEELDEISGKLWTICNSTGGWVGNFGPEDAEQLDRELAVRLISFRASEAELTALWERVRKGEDPRAAWEVVQGPSFHYYKARIELRGRLRGTNLEGMDLHGAPMSRMETELQGKNLRNANLSGADLSHSNLTATDLTGADLTDADLCDTNLAGASLENVTLTGARYDVHTRWPLGFDPLKRGVILVGETDEG